jgi:hypothetical protein
MGTNFHLSPPLKTVDGLLAVSIDSQSMDAVFIFDGATAAAFVRHDLVHSGRQRNSSSLQLR